MTSNASVEATTQEHKEGEMTKEQTILSHLERQTSEDVEFEGPKKSSLGPARFFPTGRAFIPHITPWKKVYGNQKFSLLRFGEGSQ